MSATDIPPGAEIHTFDFWARPWAERDEAFRQLREEGPIRWYPPAESVLLPPELNTEGFWSLVGFDEIRAVSRDSKNFSTRKGVFMEDFPEVVQDGSLSFLVHDPPYHTQLRGIVQMAFTPRHVRQIEDDIRAIARDLVDEMVKLDGGEICSLLSKQLPGRVFASFFSLPPGELRDEAITCAEHMAGWSDPEECGDLEPIELFANAAFRLNEIALELTEERRKEPGDDLLTWVVEAEFEGQSLEDWEIGSFFSLLAAAANDTTRHSITHALWAFEQHPEQKAYLLEDLEGRVDLAVDEVLRWSSPLLHMRRTAKVDTEIAGQAIKEGEKVVMWYCSGNRDESAFERAGEFDITRTPNRHLAFGGGGPHFCLGSNLAKQTLRAALLEVYGRMPDITVREPEFLVANFVHGIKRLQGSWTPTA